MCEWDEQIGCMAQCCLLPAFRIKVTIIQCYPTVCVILVYFLVMNVSFPNTYISVGIEKLKLSPLVRVGVQHRLGFSV